MSIPKEVSFQRLPPLAYPTHLKIMRFLPSTNSVLNPGDICRFNISTSGYWDPYTAYINLEVDVSQESTLDKYDLLQIDGSASSFISELVITCKGGELERITEYDVISNVLDDMTLSNEQRQSRDIQGLGNNTRCFNKKAGALYPDGTITYTSVKTTLGSETISETNLGVCYAKPWIAAPTSQTFQAPSSKYIVASLPTSDITKNTLNQGYTPRYISSSDIATTETPCGIGGVCDGILGSLGMNFSTRAFNGGGGGAGNSGNTVWNSGIPGIFDNDLTQGCFEPVFNNGDAYVATMVDGYYDGVVPNKRQFCIPFNSGIFGQLMPKEHYKYIPMMALEDLAIEFRMNPYAMFSSGYKPYAGGAWLAHGDDVTKFGQIPRKWKITKFEIVVDMLYFDKTIDNLILDQLNQEGGISFHTTSWYLGPLYSLPPSTTPSGTYQLNLGFESLRTLLMLFIPQDYLKYSFLRKLYRINNSITSLQLRIGLDLYPSLPMKGHSGTSSHYNSAYPFTNNNEYLISLHKAWSKFQNKDEDCSITATNFAVNQRYWSPPSFGAIVASYPGTSLPSIDTFGYMPLLHENRCKGKSLFALDLQSMSDNQNVISGLNTIKNKPFEVLLTSDSTHPYLSGMGNTFTGTSAGTTMYFFCNYDMVVQLKKYGVSIMGRGGGM